MIFEWNTLIYIVIPVIDRNYDENDVLTANIHVMIPVIDRNYDIKDVVTANLAKSGELYRNSGHSPDYAQPHRAPTLLGAMFKCG